MTLGITNYELPEPGSDACSMSQRRVTLHSRITFVTLLTWSNTFSITNTPSFNSCWVWGISFCNNNNTQIEILWTFSRLVFLLNNQPFHGKLLQHIVKDKHALPFHVKWVSLSQHGTTVGYGWCRHPQNMHYDCKCIEISSRRDLTRIGLQLGGCVVSNYYKTLQRTQSWM